MIVAVFAKLFAKYSSFHVFRKLFVSFFSEVEMYCTSFFILLCVFHLVIEATKLTKHRFILFVQYNKCIQQTTNFILSTKITHSFSPTMCEVSYKFEMD